MALGMWAQLSCGMWDLPGPGIEAGSPALQADALPSEPPGIRVNNLRYADDTTLMAESKEELKILLMKVKEENEKPLPFGERTRDCSPGHAGKGGPHLEMTVASRGFSRK